MIDTNGLFEKFRVERVDGKDKPGGDKDGAEYFVLDYAHDPDGWVAAASYAVTCSDRRPVLSQDLSRRLLVLLDSLIAHRPGTARRLEEIFGSPVKESGVWRLLITLSTMVIGDGQEETTQAQPTGQLFSNALSEGQRVAPGGGPGPRAGGKARPVTTKRPTTPGPGQDGR